MRRFVTITAKFESTCPDCERPIKLGNKVRWRRGSPASHLDCQLAMHQNSGCTNCQGSGRMWNNAPCRMCDGTGSRDVQDQFRKVAKADADRCRADLKG